jgi:transcriptional regulator with XRE-family HTH domain
MKSSKVIIGSMIKSRRKEKQFSQKHLADLLDVDRQYVWRLENGKVNLTMDYLDKVIIKLNCLNKDFIVIPKEV